MSLLDYIYPIFFIAGLSILHMTIGRKIYRSFRIEKHKHKLLKKKWKIQNQSLKKFKKLLTK